MNTHYSAVETSASSRPWRPGVFRRIPWVGICALLGSITAIGGSIAVLVCSDGTPIDSWKYPPSIYLSICYTIGNILLNAALAQGVTISWWTKAMGDAKLGDLHRYWSFGSSPVAAILAGRNFNFIAFAAIFVALTPINGPLLQRATSTALTTLGSPVDGMELVAAKAMDYGYATGYITDRGYTIGFTTDDYTPVIKDYYNSALINITSACPKDGMCYGRLPAAGLSVDCTEGSLPYNVTAENYVATGNATVGYVFNGNFTWSSRMSRNFTLDTHYKTDMGCAGILNTKSCLLRSATVEYPVIIDGNKSTIALDPNTTIFDDVLLGIFYSGSQYGLLTTDLTEGENGNLYSAIGGYVFALKNQLDSNAYIRFSGPWGYVTTSTGSTASQFQILPGPPPNGLIEGTGEYVCNITYNDPTPYYLQQARELMFRTALAAGNSSTIQTLTGGTQIRTVRVYQSHYLFLGIAVAVTAIAICTVLATFNGYWRFGREMTLSPLETAKAFNAPLLASEDSNAQIQELVKHAGDRPVRYGMVAWSGDDASGKYGEHVETYAVGQGQARLEIMNPGVVQSLRRLPRR